MKAIKKIVAVAAAAAALTVGVLSIGAAAADATPYATGDRHYFTINVSDYGKSESTVAEFKEDYYTYAVVYLENGSTVSANSPLMMRAYKVGESSAVTPIVTATKYGVGDNGRYELHYYDDGVYGARYYLTFTSGRYGATAHGSWAP